MSKLRVLEVSKSTGGLGTYMRWLAKGFDEKRYELTFACLSEGGAALAHELSQFPGVKTLYWPMNRFKIDLVGDALVIFRVARLLRREKYDLVHGHGSKAGFIVRLAAAGTSTKTAYSPHGFSFHERQNPIMAGLYAIVENFASRFLTTRVITVSDGEREEAAQRGIGTAGKFTTVHSGIEVGAFGNALDKAAIRATLNIPEGAWLVGTVGRLDEQKAPLDFVRVAAQVLLKHPNVYFVWIGAGDLESTAQELANTLGVANNMIFAGQRGDVPQLLTALDCFLLTSHWEAFPIVILEAMASRLPIVATALAGTQEAVEHNVEGLLVPVGDIDQLSAAVTRLIVDPAFALQLSINARKRVERDFTYATMMQNLMQTYEHIVGGAT